jgi:hypothetical protein
MFCLIKKIESLKIKEEKKTFENFFKLPVLDRNSWLRG